MPQLIKIFNKTKHSRLAFIVVERHQRGENPFVEVFLAPWQSHRFISKEWRDQWQSPVTSQHVDSFDFHTRQRRSEKNLLSITNITMFVFIESHARAINNSRRCLESDDLDDWTVEWNNAEVKLESIFHLRRLLVPFFRRSRWRLCGEMKEGAKPQQNGKHSGRGEDNSRN